MTDYSVIESDNSSELVEAVSKCLEEGWQCQGGVCIWYERAGEPRGTR